MNCRPDRAIDVFRRRTDAATAPQRIDHGGTASLGVVDIPTTRSTASWVSGSLLARATALANENIKTLKRRLAEPVTRPQTCPVRSSHTRHTWKNTFGITEGRAFRSIERRGHLGTGISGEYIGAAITRAGERAGLATEARRAGHDPVAIGRQGGWSDGSAALLGDMQIADRWDDNALEDIGL
ncbi:hypothetical protein [Sciscionella marina]|uniref:hypothetical protein n=1 Tax=Sciscionella marina TaxID=508770 RepID=UPI000361F0CE|nr:hypothetical protein [Sciscionella marina]